MSSEAPIRCATTPRRVNVPTRAAALTRESSRSDQNLLLLLFRKDSGTRAILSKLRRSPFSKSPFSLFSNYSDTSSLLTKSPRTTAKMTPYHPPPPVSNNTRGQPWTHCLKYNQRPPQRPLPCCPNARDRSFRKDASNLKPLTLKKWLANRSKPFKYASNKNKPRVSNSGSRSAL